jgi:hypothetical protein
MNWDKSKQTAAEAIERAAQLIRRNIHRGGISHISIYTDEFGEMKPQSEEIAIATFTPKRLIEVRAECRKNPNTLLMVKV